MTWEVFINRVSGRGWHGDHGVYVGLKRGNTDHRPTSGKKYRVHPINMIYLRNAGWKFKDIAKACNTNSTGGIYNLINHYWNLLDYHKKKFYRGVGG